MDNLRPAMSITESFISRFEGRALVMIITFGAVLRAVLSSAIGSIYETGLCRTNNLAANHRAGMGE